MSLQVRYHTQPCKRAQKSVQHARLDALITNYTPSRQQYSLASKEIFVHSPMMIFVHQEGPNNNKIRQARKITDLSPFTIGSYIGNGWAERALKGMNLMNANNSMDVLKMLSRKRFDLYPANRVSTRQKLRDLVLPILSCCQIA